MATYDSTTGVPPMIGRDLSIPDWLAYIARYDFGPVAPSRAVVHHTWRPTVAQWASQRSMQALQRYYAAKGWTAAPHLFVGPDGIWLATPLKDIGIHAGVGNSGYRNGKLWYSIGISKRHQKSNTILHSSFSILHSSFFIGGAYANPNRGSVHVVRRRRAQRHRRPGAEAAVAGPRTARLDLCAGT